MVESPGRHFGTIGLTRVCSDEVDRRLVVFTVQPGTREGQRRAIANIEAEDVTVEFDGFFQIYCFDVVVIQVMQAHFQSPLYCSVSRRRGYFTPTTASISILTPGSASSRTPISVLAGRAEPKYSWRTLLILTRSFT